MTYRPLRGRIFIRPTGDSGGVEQRAAKSGIIVPDAYKFDPRNAGRNQNSLMRGVVVAMGAPALSADGRREVVPGFQPGDEVLFIGGHVSRLVQWNGEEVRACAQEEVCGVVEYADTEPPPEFGAEGLAE
jgi:co-chaperonin GroES (HSP10)